MRKLIDILLVLVLCCGLCACGGGEEIVLPTKPAQSAVQNQPAAEETQSAETGEAEEPTESTEGKYPWEVEFREEDYVKFNITAPNGDKIVTWREGGIFGLERRNLYEWADDGTISDSYYYPSGNLSHEYTWYTDGAYHESHHLDNGYTDPETGTIWLGTIVYENNIYADGSESEQFFDENGNLVRIISKMADGTYSDTEYYENDNLKKSVFDDPTGTHYDQEYYENGAVKYMKDQSPEYIYEERWDEEGYRTYYYSKDANYEIELTADETGKLVKVVENGTVIEDAATLAQYGQDYNFRQ